MRKTLLAIAALSASATSLSAASPGPARYDVRMTMQVGEAPPETPRLTVRANEPATFVIANKRYSMRVVATVDAHAHVALASHVTSWTPNGLRHSVEDVTLVADGRPSTVASPASDPAPIRIEVRVQPAGE